MTAYRNPDPFFEAPATGQPMALCALCRCIKPADAFPGRSNVCRSCNGRKETNPPRTCPTCKAIKPFSSFWTRRDAASADSLRYNKPYMYLATNCRECRKAERPARTRQRTKREMQNLVARGAMTSSLRDEVMERRALKLRASGSDASTKRWDAEYRKAWAPVTDDLKAEIHRAAQAQKYLRHPPERANITEAETRTAFNEAYLKAMRALRERLDMDFITPRGEHGQRRRPTSTWWVDYFTTEQWNTLLDTWNAIDLDTRVKLRQPDLLKRNGEARPDDPAQDMKRR